MKKVNLFLVGIVSLLVSSQAFAFITVIDVQEVAGQVTTIQSGDQYSLDKMYGKQLSYRGQQNEAIELFEDIVQNELPEAIVESEINSDTGNISITVAVNGYLGFQYYYYVLQNAGN